MTESPPTALRVSVQVGHLDVLELVRTGALPSYPLDGRPGSLTLPLGVPDGYEATAREVELADLEGVAVARAPLTHRQQGPVAHGVPTWLAPRSSRPFEDWHVAPGAVPDRTGVVVLRGAAELDRAAAALEQAGPRPLLLLLASLDGDVDPAALETAYLADRLLELHPGALPAVAPAAGLSGAEQAAVVASYAQGRSVTVLDADPGLVRPASSGTVLFFTGLSGAGKSTLARAVRNRMVEDGRRVTLLDGDVVRRHLSAGLGFSAADRDTNVRRIGWVAAEIAHHGGTAICSPIAPFAGTREEVRSIVESRGGRFVLVHVATPLAECERRDRKGLYARARRGEIDDFTGISSPYEEPVAPDLRVDTTSGDLASLVDDVLLLLGAGARC